MTQESALLRISIWRDFTPKRMLIAQDLQNNGRQVMDSDNLQEEVYSWQASESPFDCIADESIRRQLHDNLSVWLNASLPPSERGIGVLDKFIAEAERAIASGQTEWMASQSRVDTDDNDADKINSLLAFTLHLKWLSGCFANRPGISVSVR